MSAPVPRPIVRPFRSLGPTTVETATVDSAAEALRGKRFAVVTGAGISTGSGVPDYRGPQSPQRQPMTYRQFRDDPWFRQVYWARNHIGWQHVHDTKPNAGHRALADLEAAGLVSGVITQNVDLLHEEAGSRHVVDLHGRYDEVVCLDCGEVESRDHLALRLEALNPGFLQAATSLGVQIAPDADAEIPPNMVSDFTIAHCQYCAGPLKPSIVYFGETLPARTVDQAFALIDNSQAMLIVGSSLAVDSGMRLVRRALLRELPIVIVNRGATRADQYATVRIDSDATTTLLSLAKLLIQPGHPQ